MSLKLTKKQRKILDEKIASGEYNSNSPELKKLALKASDSDPIHFASKFLKEHTKDAGTGKVTKSPPFHKEVMKMYLTKKRVGVAAPRGHAKSTLTSFIYVLWSLLFQKKKNVVIISASEDMAKRFLRRIREELQYNKRILWLFGNMMTDKWSETELRLANGTVVHAKGRGAQLRGLIDGNRRPDLIICDDLEDEELVRSELRRLDLESWFNGTVMPTLEPKIGQLIIIGTILHEDSLLNRVVSGKLYPEFATGRYAAINPNGKPLWPDRFSLADLNKIKKSMMARHQLPQFYMEYMNDPMPIETAVFRSEYFQYFEDLPRVTDVTKDFIIKELYIDLGGGSVKKTADFTAMVVLAIDQRNNIFIQDYINERFGTDTHRIIQAIFQLYEKHKVSRVVIEKTMATNMLDASLKQAMLDEKRYLNIEYVSPPRGSGDRRGNMSDGKYQRIAAMEAAFKLGIIKMRRWMVELQEQLLAFPRATHDDLADALSYGYMQLQRRMQVSEEKRQRDQEDPNDPLGLYKKKRNDEYEVLYEEIGL